MSNYISSSRPDFHPFEYDCGQIPAYRFSGNLQTELDAGQLSEQQARDLLEDMLIVREVEEMIVRLRSGAYEPIRDFNYRGPTHVSVGQEGSSVGACSVLTAADYITSTHRGHGDSLARGCVALRQMTADELRHRLNSLAATREELLEEALTHHVYRTIAELFGKEDGYCKGRGGSMHIADFSVGHLGANAIVGGNVPIATGAALGLRYLQTGGVVCCFAGDGAFSNGVVLEALNFAAQGQFVNEIADGVRFGMPIIFLIMNNHYGMTHRTDNEVTGVAHLARRAAGFADNNMHAEIVNGMDVLAVRDAVLRAAEGCREGRGPYLIELNTYRYYGHSLSDPRNEYRTREEETAWRKVDPVENFKRQLVQAGLLDEPGIADLEARVRERNACAARRATEAPDPRPEDVIKYMYTSTVENDVPDRYSRVEVKEPVVFKRV
ncbi:MAG: thiamine pyrophosphate-dependent dehydrogenase E1 component subunit alpha, partial [Acidobacteria bacterium]